MPQTDSNTPAVSVVIPAFNEADIIGDAIGSVLDQTLTDFELLVIDDGSTDGTAAAARTFDDSRLRVLTFDNQGLAASRNRGVREARAELIAFLDADDCWTPDKLAVQVEIMAAQPEAALVYSWSDCVDEDGRFLRHGSHVHVEGRVYEHLLTRNFLDNGSSAMVRKSVFESVGLFEESYRAGEDWDMWLRIADRYPLACAPQVHVLYRIRQTSMMSNVDRQFEFVESILHKGLARVPDPARRERIRRIATGNICRYLAVRLIETGTSRAHGRQAARFWWCAVRVSPQRWQRTGKLVLIGALSLAMVVLPYRWFAWLRSRGIALYRQGSEPSAMRDHGARR